MSSVISVIYISELVPFAHGSYKSNTIERVDALHRETLYPCFVIFITASLLDLTAGFQIFSQNQLTQWWRHGLDMFSAVVAFCEGTFHEINNADCINNADLWWLFVRLDKLLNKQLRVELLVIRDAMPLTYRKCNDRGPDIIVVTLSLEDRAPVDFVWGYPIFKPKELYYISWLTPQFHLYWYTWVYSVFAWTASINLRRELLNMSVIVKIITVAPGEHQGVWNQWQFNCWLNS